MSLSYKVRRVGDITILDLSGRVTLGSAGEPSLHDIVRNTLQNGGRKSNFLPDRKSSSWS